MGSSLSERYPLSPADQEACVALLQEPLTKHPDLFRAAMGLGLREDITQGIGILYECYLRENHAAHVRRECALLLRPLDVQRLAADFIRHLAVTVSCSLRQIAEQPRTPHPREATSRSVYRVARQHADGTCNRRGKMRHRGRGRN